MRQIKSRTVVSWVVCAHTGQLTEVVASICLFQTVFSWLLAWTDDVWPAYRCAVSSAGCWSPNDAVSDEHVKWTISKEVFCRRFCCENVTVSWLIWNWSIWRCPVVFITHAIENWSLCSWHTCCDCMMMIMMMAWWSAAVTSALLLPGWVKRWRS